MSRLADGLSDWAARLLGAHKERSLVILDDFYPNLLTGFRIAEFNAYLQRLPGTEVWTTTPDFRKTLRAFRAHFPGLAAPIHRYRPGALRGARLAYLNFLNNADRFLDDLTAAGVPFVMTLYPGGGFGLEEPASDAKLDRVMASPLLRHVITTQPVTTAYLKARYPGAPEVTEIYGMVVQPRYFEPMPPRGYPDGRRALRACFVADKYMPRGENKGFPAFLEAVQSLMDLPESRLEFHVVGRFTSEDAGALAGRIRFHGSLPAPRLREHLRGMDAILSPNQPFLLHPGNFDGFPTGSCMEASLCGAALLVSDPLRQNRTYEEGREILILPPEGRAFAEALRSLVEDPARCEALGRAGQARSLALFSPQVQLEGREAILRRHLG